MRGMMVRCAMVAAALVAGGAARAEGPYVGAEGGVTLPQSLDYNFIGLDNFFSTRYRTGADVAAKLGYDFEGIRLEFELGYKRASVDRFGFQLGGQPQAIQRGAGVTGHIQTLSGMLNAYYDIGRGRIRPYVGGGVGIARVTSDKVGYSGFGDDGIFLDKTDPAAFAFQVMGGVRAQLTDHLAAGIGYRFFDVRHVQLHVFSTTAKTTLQSSSVLASLTYNFGRRRADLPAPPAPPPPAPPPPPPPPPVPTSFLVSFAVGRSTLSPEAVATLDRTVTAYRQAGHGSIMIASPAETSGPTVYDDRLAARRAGAASGYLVAHGIPKAAISIQSFDPGTVAATPAGPGGLPARTIDITFGPGSGQ